MIQVNLCKACGTEFVVDRAFLRDQQHCQSCADKKAAQHHQVDSILVSRERTFATVCQIHSLPGEWVRHEGINSRSHGYWKMEVRGDMLAGAGRGWEGQLTIFAQGWARYGTPQVGDWVYFRAMKATKKKKALSFSRLGMHGEVLHDAILPIWFEESMIPQWIADGRLRPEAEGAQVEEIEVVHKYVVLEPTARTGGHRLQWVTATDKSTLKGLGAQYTSKVDLSEAHWSAEIGGGTRNLRWWTRGILVVLPTWAALSVTTTGVTGGGRNFESVSLDDVIDDFVTDFADVDDDELLGGVVVA